LPVLPADIPTLIENAATKYGVNEGHLTAVLKCESNFAPNARGDHGHSRGLSQISDIYHSEVSDAEADDPAFAIDFMAKAFANGKAHEWSCWRSRYQ
jgi:soluble lytic murein transglycosylase-like protein